MSSCTVYVIPQTFQAIEGLPGHIRQRVKQAIDALSVEPRPAKSKQLALPETNPYELRRLRLDRWRIIYAVSDAG